MSSKPAANELTRALALVTRYTRSQVRSIRDVHAYLQRRALSSELIAHVMTISTARGVLNDEIAATLWAEHWARRGYAWVAIHAKLAAKGFDDRVIAHVGTRAAIATQDEARAREVATQIGHRSAGVSRSQLARRLAVRGFDPEMIARVVDNVTAA